MAEDPGGTPSAERTGGAAGAGAQPDAPSEHCQWKGTPATGGPITGNWRGNQERRFAAVSWLRGRTTASLPT